jgi:hypothetical protein
VVAVLAELHQHVVEAPLGNACGIGSHDGQRPLDPLRLLVLKSASTFPNFQFRYVSSGAAAACFRRSANILLWKKCVPNEVRIGNSCES